MQSHTMKAAFQAVHQHDDGERCSEEDVVADEYANPAFCFQAHSDSVVKENFCQLSMC